MDRFGYVKTVDNSVYERNKEAADNENKQIVPCMSDGKICLFTDNGQMHLVKVADIPYGKFRDKGVPIDNISNFSSDKEHITAVTSQTSLNLYRVIFVTKLSMMKIVDGGEFDVSKRMVASTKLQEGDEIVDVSVLKEQKDIILQTKDGYFLKFPLEEIPEKKKGAVGVRGMKLTGTDQVENVYYTRPGMADPVIEFKEKQFDLSRIKTGRRDSKGTKPRV